MSDKGTLQLVAGELARALAPLREATLDLPHFQAFMRRLGWLVTSLPPSYADLGERAFQALAAVEALSDDATLPEVLDTIVAIGDVYRAAQALGDAPGGADAGALLAEIADTLVEFLLVEYLASARPAVYRVLEMLGVIVHEHHEATPTRPAFVHTRLRYDEIPRVLADPLSIPARVYGWGSPDLDFERAAQHLLYLLHAVGLNVSLGPVPDTLGDAFQQGPPNEIAKTIDTQVTISLFEVEIAGNMLEAGLAVLELPAEGAHPAGIIVQPAIPDGIATQVPITPEWAFKLRAGTDLASLFGIVLRPDDISVRYPFAPGTALPSAGFGVTLEYAPAAPTALLGKADRGRLEIAGGEIGMKLDYRNGQLEARLEAAPRGLTLVVSPADLDGFLGSLAGGSELAIPVTLGVAWSNRTGFSFTGGAGIAVSIYPHPALGPLTIDRVDLAVGADFGADAPPALRTSGRVTFTGAVGPVSVAVDGIGLALEFVFDDGNAGPFDVQFDFVPPTGLGLAIDAGPIAGGGFISFDHANHRYAGILHLEVFTITVTAIGLLTTRDNAGQALPPPGFSFLIIISAEFPPIQLGYGFTLNGVGGLAGLHRTIVTEALQAGLRGGSVDHILFPEDPIRNAPQIISDLQLIFPPQPNRYVFGPMALLGWGTPTLIRVELGIIIELPAPIRIVLLGQISVDLPTEDVAIVALHIDVLGLIEFDKQLISIDSTLRHSSVAGFPVTGDMAMRLAWGDRPSFALAIGGLNPKFQPPPGFPTLQRVAIALGMEDNPRISLQAYMALTSNSLQLGARGEIYAAAGGFNIYGWAGFDALVIFVPFSFRADLSAGFALRKGTRRIAGIRVEGTLTGPSPYHVWGEGCLSLLFFDICVDFDATFGERRQVELPARDPWSELEAALEDPRNWSGRLPAAVVPAVNLAPLPPESASVVLIHPSGTAVVRQRVLPLNKTLERFGEFELAGPNRYEVATVSIGGTTTSAWTPVSDFLPPSLSESLSDADKLSRDSYELEVVGVEAGVPDAAHGAVKAVDVEYESRIVDSTWEVRNQGRFRLDRDQQLFLVGAGAKAYSPLWNTGARKFSPAPGTPSGVSLEDESYVIATVDDLLHRPELGRYRSKGAALQALKAHVARTPGDRGTLQVVSSFEAEVEVAA
jgi:hypothetical protein